MLRRAKIYIASRKNSGLRDMDLVSGKAVFSASSEIINKRYGTSLNAMAACRVLKLSECDNELIDFIKSIT